jgi:hypothetical protein
MTNYAKIDHTNRRIIMDRTFAKNAEIVGSAEYKQLQDCRKDYPDYTVVRREIKRNPNQEHYKGLTYRYMEEYIMTHESRDTVRAILDEFYEKRLISEGHSKAFRYPTIKQWFFEKYPEFLEYGMKKNAEDHKVNVLKIPNDSAAADIKKGA